MDKQFLCLDSPTDFMVGKYISADELKEFINIPCKIKAGVFILCMEGQIRSTINMSELTTSKLNVVTLLPNSRIQIHEISPDILIYFIAFSFDFMCYANFIKCTMGYLLIETSVISGALLYSKGISYLFPIGKRRVLFAKRSYI